MTNFIQKYGKTALVAGASEGIGAAYATHLAALGMDLVLIARRQGPLQLFADELEKAYAVKVTWISCDLSDPNAPHQIEQAINGKDINLVVYNAALSYIGPFIENTFENHAQMAQVNMMTPLYLLHIFGKKMISNGKGAVILMASLAGFQGSGFLTMYAATKAFNRVLAESLWYEWKNKGIDVIACCAGATSTPNFINTKPEKASLFAPRVQTPDEVVTECLKKLGHKPSFIAGSGNKMASFLMQKLLPRKVCITIMGDNTKKMYRL
jgi:short-subunit dehydrogenase